MPRQGLSNGLKIPNRETIREIIVLKDVALVLEHEFQYGGAQRLAALLAERTEKNLYYIGDGSYRVPCWDKKVINEVPKEKYLFSLTVDKSKPISIEGKVHIKFMHSFETIRRLNSFEEAKDFIWVTHRKRVYQAALEMGYKIYLIPDGFILYDHKLDEKYFHVENKEDVLASISSISCTADIASKLVFTTIPRPRVLISSNCLASGVIHNGTHP